MSNSLQISKHITLGSSSIWLNTSFLLFLTKKNILFTETNSLNVNNLLFLLLIQKTMNVSVTNWNPINLYNNLNSHEKYDKYLSKILYIWILYFNISKYGLKYNFKYPILIILSYFISSCYNQTTNHIRHAIFHLLFRNIGFIWMNKLILKNSFNRFLPMSLFYWINSFHTLYKYKNISLDYENDINDVDNIYLKECEINYLYSLIGYFCTLKIWE